MKDPICGMEVDPNTSAYSYEHNGQVHFFCCHHCREKFRAEPEKYLFPSVPDTAESGPTHAAVTAQPGNGNVYTCPMDPEVRQSKPGVRSSMNEPFVVVRPTLAQLIPQLPRKAQVI